MSVVSSTVSVHHSSSKRGLIAGTVIAVIVIATMAFNTKFVAIGSDDDIKPKVFSKEEFGAQQFPKVQKYILEHAVDAKTLVEAIIADRAEAGKKYGVETSTGPVIPVTLTGVAGEAKSGIYSFTVEGLPEGYGARVQMGPAINGTDLRDASGEISFGQFTNQIEYQDAGSALNMEMKKQVLTPIDTTALTGKTVTLTGVFKLINPKNWLVTPVKLSVK